MSGRKLETLLLWALIAGLVLAAVGLIVNYSRQRNPEVVASAATDNDGCLTCHGDPYYRPKTSDRPWQELYTDQATLAASTHRSVTCTNCHQTFDTGQPMEAASAQALCGRCHEQQQKLQAASVHSDIKVTSCLSCHSKEQSGHDILPVLSADSPVFSKNVPRTCGGCHSDQQLMASYELNPEVYDVYMDGPHGKVLKLTGADSDGLNPATCSACHGSHDVRATDDPKALVSDEDRRGQLCGRCHDGASGNFAGSITIHTRTTAGGTPSAFYGERFFFILTASVATLGILIVVLAGFGWLFRRAARAGAPSGLAFSVSPGGAEGAAILGVWPGSASLPAPGPSAARVPLHAAEAITSGPQEVERFDVHQRLQHFVMMASFLVLAFTGLPQKFPDWEISQWLIGMWGGLDSARAIHRFAGLVMVTDSVYHIGYVALNMLLLRRQPSIAMLPTPKDVTDFLQDLRYWFGRSTEKPKFGRFSYLEKFDYWAIFWGMPVMALSGLTLMFAVLVSQVLPGDVIQIAFVAHSDEALLAVLWIFLVHLFFVHINPRFFPLNRAIFTGRMPRHVYAEEHPLELAEIEQRRSRGS
ncbi:MAG: hypothetical protein HYY03_10220 [Chloroflexi bacterium]|nr:hypothetical protein [Chloroflexota bacterium]